MSGSVTFKVSAPGKIILFGEHSVVYGKTAVAASLGLRTHLEAQMTAGSIVHVDLPAIGLERSWNVDVLETLEVPLLSSRDAYSLETPELVDVEMFIPQLQAFVRKTTEGLDEARENALIAFLLLYTGMCGSSSSAPGGVTLRVSSELAAGAGAGSSASYGACLAAALYHILRLRHQDSGAGNATRPGFRVASLPAASPSLSERERSLVLGWALLSDRVMHGNPSGVDATVACRGGAVAFRKPVGAGDSPHMADVPCGRVRALLVYSNVPRNTKTKVAEVAALRARFGTVVDGVMAAMDALALKAQALLAELAASEDAEAQGWVFDELQTLVSMNQHLLSALGVSHAALDAICATARRHGLAGKLTGGGGGGYVFALLPPGFSSDQLAAVTHDLAAAGFSDARVVDLGGRGLALELGQ